MKILTEQKEELPVSFITSFISEGWDRVGVLKDQVESIKDTFFGVDKVANILQDLMDAYLICIGQMEAVLHNTEAISTLGVPAETEIPVQVETPAEKLDVVKFEAPAITEEPIEVASKPKVIPEEKPFIGDTFEYFVDFDEPDLSEPKLTDEDIYPEEKK